MLPLLPPPLLACLPLPQATSVFQFWGQRWDVSVSSHLRMLFYEPIMDGARARRAGFTCCYCLPHFSVLFIVYCYSLKP